MAKDIRNMGASVRGRLLNHSRETGRNYNLLLTRYVRKVSSGIGDQSRPSLGSKLDPYWS